MTDTLTDMEYITAAIANGLYGGVTMTELLRLSMDSNSPADFDARVNEFTNYTRED